MPTAPVLPKLVGQRVKRREDPRLIQGRGTYVDDIALVGMQHVAFKRGDRIIRTCSETTGEDVCLIGGSAAYFDLIPKSFRPVPKLLLERTLTEDQLRPDC